jgi:imidazolonepropionase-like amidohydrolase
MKRQALGRATLDKLEAIMSQGLRALEMARAEGVPVVVGTDLLCRVHDRQSREPTICAIVQPPAEVLQSAATGAARLLGREREISGR